MKWWRANTETVEEKDIKKVEKLSWDSGDLNSLLSYPTDFLYDPEKVTSDFCLSSSLYYGENTSFPSNFCLIS